MAFLSSGFGLFLSPPKLPAPIDPVGVIQRKTSDILTRSFGETGAGILDPIGQSKKTNPKASELLGS